MCAKSCWTPFQRQCFVTLAVILNSMTVGLVTVFAAVLLDQLKTNKDITIDEHSASWIVSITAISLFVGALIIPLLMNKQGRRIACIVTAAITTTGWICMYMASSVSALLVARFLLGFPLGFIAILAPVAIGEYTSPKYRGMLLTAAPLAISVGCLLSHTLGSMLYWRTIALIYMVTTFIDILLLLFCPESPTIFAVHGKFEECKKVFRWLRGTTEEQELDKIIKSQIAANEIRRNRNVTNFGWFKRVYLTMKVKEFYKPIIIMFHLHMINEWSGNTLHDSLTYPIYRIVIGQDIDVSPFILVTDVQKILSSVLAIFIIRRVSRRSLLFTTVLLNIIAYLTLALYVYAKTHKMLPFDHYLIGVVLINLLLFSSAVGTVPIPNIISGEIFPLEFKGVSSTMSVLFFSVNYFVNMKIMPLLLSSVGLHGAFVVFACVLCYGAVVSWVMLPETKGKTLLDIEEEFRGYKFCELEENERINC